MGFRTRTAHPLIVLRWRGAIPGGSTTWQGGDNVPRGISWPGGWDQLCPRRIDPDYGMWASGEPRQVAISVRGSHVSTGRPVCPDSHGERTLEASSWTLPCVPRPLADFNLCPVMNHHHGRNGLQCILWVLLADTTREGGLGTSQHTCLLVPEVRTTLGIVPISLPYPPAGRARHSAYWNRRDLERGARKSMPLPSISNLQTSRILITSELQFPHQENEDAGK